MWTQFIYINWKWCHENKWVSFWHSWNLFSNTFIKTESTAAHSLAKHCSEQQSKRIRFSAITWISSALLCLSCALLSVTVLIEHWWFGCCWAMGVCMGQLWWRAAAFTAWGRGWLRCCLCWDLPAVEGALVALVGHPSARYCHLLLSAPLTVSELQRLLDGTGLEFRGN